MSGYKLLAELVLLIHFSYVAFVVVGLLLVWSGYFLSWGWVRNFWFRTLHIVAMAIVVIETLCGVTCPLTTWESQLRRLAGEAGDSGRSFMQEWVHRIMFFDWDESTFAIIYVVFFVALVLSFVLVRPHRPRFLQARPPGREPATRAPGSQDRDA